MSDTFLLERFDDNWNKLSERFILSSERDDIVGFFESFNYSVRSYNTYGRSEYGWYDVASDKSFIIVISKN